jgi:hypothetical protein
MLKKNPFQFLMKQVVGWCNFILFFVMNDCRILSRRLLRFPQEMTLIMSLSISTKVAAIFLKSSYHLNPEYWKAMFSVKQLSHC